MSGATNFPQPLPDDPEDVTWALSTAQTMWGRGDHAEAIRWIKRASDAAADANNDERALALARQAAELKATIGSVAPPPEPAPAPVPPVPPAPPVPAVQTSPPPAPEPSASPPRGPAAPQPQKFSVPRPAAGTPAPAPTTPLPTAGTAPTAGGGFRPRPPGASAPVSTRSPSVRPAPSPGRPIPPPDPSPPAPAPRAPEAPSGVRPSRPQEVSSTEVKAFQPPTENDPDDWPTHAFSGEEDVPQLMNEAQETIATSFHPTTPAQFYAPTPAPPSASAPAPSVPTPSPASASASIPVALASTSTPAPAPGLSLASRGVWVVSTPGGVKILPTTQARPAGAVEAVLVGPAELDGLLR